MQSNKGAQMNKPENKVNFKPAFVTIREIAKIYPFSESSIRWTIATTKDRNFLAAIHRVGRRVFLEKNAFEKWFNSGGKSREGKKYARPCINDK